MVKEEVIKHKKKRVNFPWIKKKQGRIYKTMLAVLSDKTGWEKVIKGDETFGSFINSIIDKTNKIFPTMYEQVKDFYGNGGRQITENDFKVIVIGRIRQMFWFKPKEKIVEKLSEHPSNTEKLKNSIRICNKLLKKKITWDQYLIEKNAKS